MKKSRKPEDGLPLLADLRGLERDGDALRCPLCGRKAKTLYVTSRKLNRCADCLGRRILEKQATYLVA